MWENTDFAWKLRISARSWSSCCCWLSCCFRSSAIRFLLSSMAGPMRHGEFIQWKSMRKAQKSMKSTKHMEIYEESTNSTRTREKESWKSMIQSSAGSVLTFQSRQQRLVLGILRVTTLHGLLKPMAFAFHLQIAANQAYFSRITNQYITMVFIWQT